MKSLFITIDMKKITLMFLYCLILSACIASVLPNKSVNSTPSISKIAEKFVKLALALGEHDKNYVDAYYGPPVWRNETQKLTLHAIAAKADELLVFINKLAPVKDKSNRLRHHYLKKLLIALKTHALLLSGSINLTFDEQAKLIYDIDLTRYKLVDFDRVLDQLDKLLPGNNSLAEKSVKFRKQFEIPQEKLVIVIQTALDECRKITKRYINLPNNENFTIELVNDKPWAAYNWYKGNALSLIQINQSLPMSIYGAISLSCHEGYPGHHVFSSLVESELVNKRGWVEFSILPLISPVSLMNEGVSVYALHMAFPGEEKKQFIKEILCPLAGISPDLIDDYFAYIQLSKKLRFAEIEIARQYIDGEINKNKAIELMQKYTLTSYEKSKNLVRFIDTYGVYIINYAEGSKLVKQYIESGLINKPKERWDRFEKLFTTPRLPSSINW